MKSLGVGFLFILGILFFVFDAKSIETYTHYHSIVLVVGGTFAIFLLATPWPVVTTLAAALREMNHDENASEVKSELLKLIEDPELGATSKNPMIQYASSLWTQGIAPELFIVLVSNRKREIESEALDVIQALKNFAKYPPALGMIGTVMGMVSLFSHLDQAKTGIGGALALAMTATFFGLIISNVIVSPIADRLHVRHIRKQRSNEIVYEILLLINRGEANSVIAGGIDGHAA